MPIRVLLAHLPHELQQALGSTLSEEPDMIVSGVQRHVEMLLAAEETQADVLVIGMENNQPPGVVSYVLEEYPSLRIILVNIGDQHGFLYELRPELIPIGEVSSPQFPEVIRAVARGQESV